MINEGFKAVGEDFPVFLHPKTKVTRGVKQLECSQMLTNFFKKKR